MQRRNSLGQFCRWSDTFTDRLTAELMASEQETMREALEAARDLSSGPYSQEQLNFMGNPYARAQPNPPANPAVINIQSGRFYAAWQAQEPQLSGAVITTRIFNDSPEAAFLENGTRFMIERPLPARVKQMVETGRRERIDAAVQRAMKGGTSE